MITTVNGYGGKPQIYGQYDDNRKMVTGKNRKLTVQTAEGSNHEIITGKNHMQC